MRRAPWLPPPRAVAEMARRLAVRPGWTVVDDPDPSLARPSFVAHCGEDPPVLCSRYWLRLLAVEARDRLA